MDARNGVRADPVPPGGRVVVFRALPGLGDFLCAVPALRALRRARPDAEIAYVGLPEIESLARRFDAYIDQFLPFPGFPGLPDRRPDVRRLPGFLASVQSWSFDLAIQLHGSGELTNPIVSLFSGRRMAGHYRKSSPGDASLCLPWLEGCSEVRRGLRLMAHLGWPSDDETLEFPIADEADRQLNSIEGVAALLSRPFVCIHPGAASPERRWSPAGFAEVADSLSEIGYLAVLTGGPRERELTALVGSLMRHPSVDLGGQTPIDALAALLRRSALLICNDTGISHLAAALAVPSIVVFRHSNKQRWAPLDERLHRPVFGSARQVLSEARRALRRTRPHAA